MNKIGMLFCYWIVNKVNKSLDEYIELTKKSNVEVLEISQDFALRMNAEEKREFKAKLADNGLLVNYNGGLTLKNDIASDDPAIREEGVEYSKRALEAISQAGGTNWSGINYSSWLHRPQGHFLAPDEKKRILDLSVNSMRKIIKTAEDVGVVYGYEIVNRFEQFLLNTAKEGVEYCEMVGSPNAKLNLDTFHMNIEEDDMRESIVYAQQKDRLAHFHIGENNRRVPGIRASHIDWKGVFDAIKKSGYSGYIVMEPFVAMGNTSICVWRDLVEDTGEEALIADAVKGAEFIRGMLK
jgi:D-psicose/D-tagatose/L-ribulose 3-epimerase